MYATSMATLTEIVADVANRFRDEYMPDSWKVMPIEASWGSTSFFYFRQRYGSPIPGMGHSQVRFGSKCVEWNAENPSRGRLAVEMIKLGLAETLGMSPAMILAALICHEFAHARVHDAGQWVKGYQHGPAFYVHMKYLLEKYGDYLALQVAEKGGEHLLDVPEASRVAVAALPRNGACERLSKQDNVTFSYDGQTLRGVVVEARGRGKVKVAVQTEGFNRDAGIDYFKVPRHLLTKI